MMATSPVCRSSSLLKTSSLLSCFPKRKRSTSTGWVFALPAHAHITHSRRFNSCMGLLFGFLFFLIFQILEMVDFRVTDGLVDLRLFAVIASLAQKIASME